MSAGVTPLAKYKLVFLGVGRGRTTQRNGLVFQHRTPPPPHLDVFCFFLAFFLAARPAFTTNFVILVPFRGMPGRLAFERRTISSQKASAMLSETPQSRPTTFVPTLRSITSLLPPARERKKTKNSVSASPFDRPRPRKELACSV